MSASRNTRLAATLVRLRSPLACIELGADQLRRDATTPAARALAERLLGAVAQVDAGLGAALSGLLGPAERPATPDCRNALTASWERLAPLLHGAGVEAELSLPAAPVPGDAGTLRRLAIALVRDARIGGSFALRLVDEGSRYGFEVDGVETLDFAQARARALEVGADFESELPGMARAWLARPEPA